MNLAQLRTEFFARGFDYLNDGGVGQTRADLWINQSYMEILEMDDWPFLQATAEGNNPLTISDLGTVFTVRDQTNNQELRWMDERDQNEIYGGNFTGNVISSPGTPESFFITGGDTIQSYPTNTVALEVRYFKIPSLLANIGDVPVLPIRYHYAIVDYAAARGYIDSDNPELAQVSRSEGDRLVGLMRERLLFQQHQDPGYVTVYGYSEDW